MNPTPENPNDPKGETLVTFGFDHAHEVNGKTFDKDCVARISDVTAAEGRARAFELFGPKFCFEYHSSFDAQPDLSYFPRGIIDVD